MGVRRKIINNKFPKVIRGVIVVVAPQNKLYEAELPEYEFEVAGEDVQRVWDMFV